MIIAHDNRANRLMGLLLFLCLLPYLLIAIYSFPFLDDLGYATTGRNGVWAGSVNYYTSWTGRYFATLLQVGLPGIGPFSSTFPFFMIANLLLETTVNWCLISALATGRLFRWRLLPAALGITAMYVSHVPNILESHYWLAGVATYTMGNTLLTMAAALLIRWQRNDRRRHLHVVLAAACVLAATGTHELIGIYTLGMLLVAVAVFAVGRDARWRPAAILLAVAAVGFAIVILAPGNAKRSAETIYVGAHNMEFTLRATKAATWGLAQLWFRDSMNLAATILALPLCWHIAGRSVLRQARAWHAIAAIGLVLAVIAGSNALCFWSLGQTVPTRVTNPMYWFFLWGWFGVLTIALAAWRRHHPTPPRLPTPVIILATVALVAGITLSSRGTWVGCFRQLVYEAPEFRAALALREQMIAEQKALGVTDVEVYELPVKPRIICYYDITDDPDYGKNQNAARYYQIGSIRTVPRPD